MTANIFIFNDVYKSVSINSLFENDDTLLLPPFCLQRKDSNIRKDISELIFAAPDFSLLSQSSNRRRHLRSPAHFKDDPLLFLVFNLL